MRNLTRSSVNPVTVEAAAFTVGPAWARITGFLAVVGMPHVVVLLASTLTSLTWMSVNVAEVAGTYLDGDWLYAGEAMKAFVARHAMAVSRNVMSRAPPAMSEVDFTRRPPVSVVYITLSSARMSCTPAAVWLPIAIPPWPEVAPGDPDVRARPAELEAVTVVRVVGGVSRPVHGCARCPGAAR